MSIRASTLFEEFRPSGVLQEMAGHDAVIEVIGAIVVSTFTNLYNNVNRTEVDFPAAPAI